MRSLDSIIHHFDFVILTVWFYSVSALPHNETLHILEYFVGTWNPKLKWIEVVFGTPPLKGFLEPESEWTKEDLAGYFRKVPDPDFDCQDVVLEIGMLGLLQLTWGSCMEKVSSEQGSEWEEYLTPIPGFFTSNGAACTPPAVLAPPKSLETYTVPTQEKFVSQELNGTWH